MNWGAISAVADLIAAAAVILSLGYVAIQIRHNTVATRLAALQALTSDLGNALQTQAAHSELADIMARGMEDLGRLNSTERFQFLSQLGHVFRLYESLHSHHLAGTLDPEIWAGYEVAIHGLLAYPGVRSVWTMRQEFYGASFRRFVASGLADSGAPALFGAVVENPEPSRQGP